MSRHDELRELLGAYALDAVSEDERAEIAAHLEGCAECRSEVAAFEAPVARLSTVSRSFGERALRAVGGPVDDSRPRRRRGAAMYAALVLLVAVAGLVAVSERRNTAQLRDELEATRAPLDALADVTVDGNEARLLGGDRVIDVVVLADRRALLWRDNLPELAADESYHLWGVVDGDLVEVGPLGPDPHLVVTSVPSRATELVITHGPRGRAQPTDSVVASGAIETG